MKNTIIALATSAIALGSASAQTIVSGSGPAALSPSFDISNVFDGVAGTGYSSQVGVSTGTFTFSFDRAYSFTQFSLNSDVGTLANEGPENFTLNFLSGGSVVNSFSGTAINDATSDPAQVFNFSATGFADSVEFVVLSSFPNSGGTAGDIQFNEVSFSGTIPEPSSALLLGLSALGFIGRRKR